MSRKFYKEIQNELELLSDKNRLRKLRMENRSEFIHLSSNDYLGLAQDKDCLNAGYEAAQQFGNGGQSSRLVSGNASIHVVLERELSEWLAYESALLFPSGYQLNTSVLSAIGTKETLFLADKQIHNSMVKGALQSQAEFKRFRHNDVKHAESILEKERSKYKFCWILVESLYSMDGDKAPLNELNKLANLYDCLLYVDEAHALGVYGEKGRGLAFPMKPDVIVGTFGKAFGSNGAFLASSADMIQYMVNKSGGFIYSTALSPFSAGAAKMALQKIMLMDAERNRLSDWSKRIRSALKEKTVEGDSPIIPWIVGSDKNALELAETLNNEGFFATAIRPPTVAEGTARIRITLTARVSDLELARLEEFIRCQA
ncbi:8-amino-7-oxononanoate synthase [bacterium]|nr:MAG: 8-amino-7-oxononanoate synthase [bacterium]